MSDIERRWRCEYKYTDNLGWKRHTWSAVGAKGAVHLHITVMPKSEAREHPDDQYSGGLEVHYRTPPEYMAKDAPSHDRCWLLKCPCWHDGSSMYASEHWIPMFRLAPDDHDGMFASLRGEADRRFSDDGELGQ